jgi:hypothetical protein
VTTPTPLDLGEARVALADNGIDGPDLPYNPRALHAMRIADALLAEVEQTRALVAAAATAPKVNFPLLAELSTKPHPLLNIGDDCQFICTTHNDDHYIGEVEQEARNAHHLLDMVGIPRGVGYASDLDSRTHLALVEIVTLRERLDRIAGWHARATGPAGMVADDCTECGQRWPCDTRRMAEGTYVDDAEEAP